MSQIVRILTKCKMGLGSEPHTTVARSKEKSMSVALYSYSKQFIHMYASFIRKTIENTPKGRSLESKTTGYDLKRWTVLSSPFVHKKARTQFERRRYFRDIAIYDVSSEGCKRLAWYFWRNAPPGINMDIEIERL